MKPWFHRTPGYRLLPVLVALAVLLVAGQALAGPALADQPTGSPTPQYGLLCGNGNPDSACGVSDTTVNHAANQDCTGTNLQPGQTEYVFLIGKQPSGQTVTNAEVVIDNPPLGSPYGSEDEISQSFDQNNGTIHVFLTDFVLTKDQLKNAILITDPVITINQFVVTHACSVPDSTNFPINADNYPTNGDNTPTPELDSVVLFGVGVAGLAAYALYQRRRRPAQN